MSEEALVEEEVTETPAVAEESVEVEQPADETVEEAVEEPVEETSAEDGEAEAKEDTPSKPPAWALNRINQLTKEKHEAKREAEDLKRRYEQAEQRQHAAPPSGGFSEAEVNRRASELVQQRTFDDACNTTYQTGKDAYGDEFDAALGNFALFGGIPDGVADIANQIPGGHEVMFKLGQNPDEIQRVLSLPPIKMALEMQKLANSGKPAATHRPISKAPTPIKPAPVGGGVINKDPSNMTMDEFAAWRSSKR